MGGCVVAAGSAKTKKAKLLDHHSALSLSNTLPTWHGARVLVITARMSGRGMKRTAAWQWSPILVRIVTDRPPPFYPCFLPPLSLSSDEEARN